MILCGGLHLSHGETLKCEFREWSFSYVGNMYYCDVTSLDNSFNNMTIDGFTGVHMAGRTDNNVRGIGIHNTNTKYIPANLGVLFNLTTLIVESSNVIEIKAENFLGMQELQVLSLYDNKLRSLASDTFSTLTKLGYLSLFKNQLEVIPSNLFSNNMNLETIDLDDNQIKYIGSGVFDQLQKLDIVNLSGNICVSENYDDIIQLKEDVKSKCNNPNDPYEIITNLQQENKELKSQLSKANEELQQSKDNLRELLSLLLVFGV